MHVVGVAYQWDSDPLVFGHEYVTLPCGVPRTYVYLHSAAPDLVIFYSPGSLWERCRNIYITMQHERKLPGFKQ